LAVREGAIKKALLEEAGFRRGQRVLDVGCGTGTLLISAAAQQPGLELVGLDADAEILELARAKADSAAAEISFDQALASEMPYSDHSFDRILSSLFFHHLTDEEKAQTARQVTRVLKPGGELHVADFGQPSDPVMSALFFGFSFFDGRDRTRSNGQGRLPGFFAEAGLRVEQTARQFRTPFGTVAVYRATSPS
jgi:ubiquinone/menaquinone biosynthesis C-methylase UbiE